MIIRTTRKNRFTVIPNDLLEDHALDWKDLGLLVYLLSKPDNWEISVDHLRKQRSMGRDAIYKCLDAIISAGYARRKKQSDGTVDWMIFDEKIKDENQENTAKKPNPEKPEKEVVSQILKSRITENPYYGNTDTNKDLNNKQELKEKTKTECLYTRERVCTFADFYEIYPRKVNKESAMKAWAKISPELHEVILEDVKNRTVNHIGWQDRQYIPHPSTYLNQKRWEDEIEVAQKNPVSAANRKPGFVKQPMQRPDYSAIWEGSDAIDSTAMRITDEPARV